MTKWAGWDVYNYENKHKEEAGFCVRKDGRDVNHNISKHPDEDLGKDACLAWCTTQPGATGCEHIANQGNKGCYFFTAKDVVRGNGAPNHLCWIFHFAQRFVCEGSFLNLKDQTECDAAALFVGANFRCGGHNGNRIHHTHLAPSVAQTLHN